MPKYYIIVFCIKLYKNTNKEIKYKNKMSYPEDKTA